MDRITGCAQSGTTSVLGGRRKENRRALCHEQSTIVYHHCECGRMMSTNFAGQNCAMIDRHRNQCRPRDPSTFTDASTQTEDKDHYYHPLQTIEHRSQPWRVDDWSQPDDWAQFSDPAACPPPPPPPSPYWIVVDTEGVPAVEVAAFAFLGNALVSVFHVFVKHPQERMEEDRWSRTHVHGIPLRIPISKGMEYEEMLMAWAQWRSHYPVNTAIYVNDARSDIHVLQCPLTDWSLKEWALRGQDASHRVANIFKNGQYMVRDIYCPRGNHCAFRNYRPPMSIASRPRHQWPAGHLTREAHGHHCAFYDCVELALDIGARHFGFESMMFDAYCVSV